MKKTVVVGLSGGVDSSVAAYLLKKEFKVIGLFMKNWHDESVTLSNDCPWLEDSYDAMLVAEKLNIPFQTIDLSEIYKKKIIDYMFSEYKKGRTPNPDILCNREIKFEIFLNVAISLGADFIATGHYCIKKEISNSNGSLFRLIKGKDNEKDQSYFLCQLNQKQLSKSLFPLGGFLKSEIRQIAKNAGLWPGIIGGLAGGIWMIKLGINKALWIFGFMQMFATLSFAWLAISGDNNLILAITVGLEFFAAGLGTTAFIAYIAKTTHPKYTATQFALFTGLASVPRTFTNASTGYLVEFFGWYNFYIFCALIAIPGMLLLFKIAPWNQKSS